MFVGPFEEALFAMSPGEIRGPVKTQFGYHVLQLEEVEAGRIKTFDEARVELEDEYRKERAQTIFYDQSQKLADAAFSSLTELDSVAKTMDLPLKTVSGFTREGGGELGQEPGVVDAAFSDDVLERARTARWSQSARIVRSCYVSRRTSLRSQCRSRTSARKSSPAEDAERARRRGEEGR